MKLSKLNTFIGDNSCYIGQFQKNGLRAEITAKTLVWNFPDFEDILPRNDDTLYDLEIIEIIATANT